MEKIATKKTRDAQSFYCTSNIYLASFLKANGFHFVELKTIPGASKKEFVLRAQGQDAVALAQEYYSGGQVPAKVFVEALFDLRGTLFNLNGR